MSCCEDYPFSLIEKINDRLSNIKGINNGGCLVYASHVAKRLNYFHEAKIAVYGRYKWVNCEEIRGNVKNTHSHMEWYYNGFEWSHAYVEFKWGRRTYICDCTGIYRKKKHMWSTHHFIGYLTFDEAIAFASNSHGWNPMFDRKQIGSMKGKIGRVFSKFYRDCCYEGIL